MAYRRRAKFVLVKDAKSKQARLGFRQAHSHQVIDIERCPILIEPLNAAYQALRFDLLPQASRQEKEIKLLATEQGIWLNQHSTSGLQDAPHYQIDELTLQFEPTGFIQVNGQINQALIQTALNWLQPNNNQQILDLFCGIGNFSLPLARHAKQVVGVDLDPQAIAYARTNAQHNQLPHASFYTADLFQPIEQQPWWQQHYDITLLDPGRQGAQQICEQLGKHSAPVLLYISCNSSTLIRDLKILEQQGYRLKKAAIFDMFPHTSHYESMVLLERKATA
jgi:23S rRNA (uracil1939-C5)-methyltransferase